MEAALDHAAARVLEIRAAAERIPIAPYRGESYDDILRDLRYLTLDRAIYRFNVEEEHRTIRFLAVFLSGQDHTRRILARLLPPGEAVKRETAPLRHLGLPDDLFDREDVEQAAIDAGEGSDSLGIWRGRPSDS